MSDEKCGRCEFRGTRLFMCDYHQGFQDGAAQEAQELQAFNDKLADILKRTAIALKGPEPELIRWGWSDLPEIAEQFRRHYEEAKS